MARVDVEPVTAARRPTLWVVLFFLPAALILSGCLQGDSEPAAPEVLAAHEAAEQLIAGPLAGELDLGPLVVSCPDMTGAVGGDVYPCTATTEAQRQINVNASVLPSGQVELFTTNVIRALALPSFEQEAVNAINAQPDITITLGPDAVDCGETAVVLTDDRMMICAVTDPQTQQVFDVSLTIEDIEARQFRLVVAASPRG